MSKVWFITGAGSGIGAGTAKAALKAGDRVVATGRNLDKVRQALGDENLAFVQLDVADEAQAKVAVEEAVQRFGRIDVLVNNAGYSLLGNFEDMTTRRCPGLRTPSPKDPPSIRPHPAERHEAPLRRRPWHTI